MQTKEAVYADKRDGNSRVALQSTINWWRQEH